MDNLIKELPSLEGVNIAEQTQQSDRGKSEWTTFEGESPKFPVGEEFVLAYDPEKPIFGKKSDKGDFRHVRLTAVDHSHETVSIPLSYFTRPIYMRGRDLAVFSNKDGKAYLLGGQIPHDLHIPGGLTEDALIKHLHGTRVIVKDGDHEVDHLALPFGTADAPIDELRKQLRPKVSFRVTKRPK